MSHEITQRIVQDAADALGEGLLDAARRGGAEDYEGVAKATIVAALARLADSEPAPDRVDAVARAIYAATHDPGKDSWTALDSYQRGYWHDVARAAVQAADRSVLAELRST